VWDVTAGRAGYGQIAAMLTAALGESVRYEPVPPLQYALRLRKRCCSNGYILFMMALHWLPRIGSSGGFLGRCWGGGGGGGERDGSEGKAALQLSSDFERVMGRAPVGLAEFIQEHRRVWVAGSGGGLMPTA